jgi:hypothetical protein
MRDGMAEAVIVRPATWLAVSFLLTLRALFLRAPGAQPTPGRQRENTDSKSREKVRPMQFLNGMNNGFECL